MNHPYEELEDLLFKWEEREFSPEDRARLNEILEDDQEAQEYFVQLQLMDAAMRLGGGSGILIPASKVANKKEQPRQNFLWLGASVALVLCVICGWMAYQFGRSTGQVKRKAQIPNEQQPVVVAEATPNAGEATSRGIALLTRLVDVEMGCWSK